MESRIICDLPGFNNVELKLKGFKVYEIEETAVTPLPTYSRRDFYKVCLIYGKSAISYADKGIEIEGPYLFFGTPHIPYSSDLLSEKLSGYACLFTEEFLKAGDRSESLQESPLFKIGATPVFALNTEQEQFIATVFRKMLSEQDTDYAFKGDLIRNYINLIIHEALKMQPSENFFKHKNASSRIASLFFELLERQFPIDNPLHPLELKTAQDYAKRLSVHVNHLNRSVKEVTGKPTTALTSERIVNEAKALLQHTDWSVSDVAYGLGFEYPAYFNNFFKKLTGITPKAVRA